MYELLWFVGGALAYKSLSKLLKLYQLFALFQETQLNSIAMLKAVSEDVGSVLTIKHELLKEAEVPEEEREQVKQIDDMAQKIWQEASVKHIIKCTPSCFKSTVKFTNWNESVKYFDEITKNTFGPKNE